MEYLQVLDTVRSITGHRGEDRFPPAASPAVVFRSGQGAPTTFLVFNATTAKQVLESPAYKQCRFLDRIFTIAKPDQTKWIRRLCDVGLIMIDGEEHLRRRQHMAATLDRCIERLKGLPAGETGRLIEEAATREGASAASVARVLVRQMISESIAAVVGREIVLPVDHLFQIDFFNPFPTLSTLARCDASLAACCEAIDVESLDADTQAVVLSLLVMGVRPLQAVISALLNQCVDGLKSGLSLEAALAGTAKLDSYNIVPTNFVMRECTGPALIESEPVVAGDIVYLFLGSATGCPFSRQSAVPFGAGTHYCSGAKLTTVMMWAVRSGLATVDHELLSRLAHSPVEQGKASAFAIFL